MRRASLLGLAALALLSAGLGVWQLRESRWRGPLYCFAEPGQVWGVAPVPAGVTPTCPQSRSYRQEVRSGQARVEQYVVPGWQPRALIAPLEAGGYVALNGQEGLYRDADEFAALLNRGAEQIQYVADKLPGPQTLVTLSGR
ncbi:hypothetical protein RDMS_13695 [Deinococcus sp. RL]|uniref:hypothetical protein n=1 Tax=Deinococcus sp. RL TaxID=1489678 RepID=UPI0004D8CD96|nr:hypothetical protein [Deinococcus sp. RL]KEF33242.1 hypothetical protein RDMS_13695 [Deinococcus sp. RL]